MRMRVGGQCLFYITVASYAFFFMGGRDKLSSLTLGTICRSLHSLCAYLLVKSQCECQRSQTIRQTASGFGFTGIYTEISDAETEFCSDRRIVPKVTELS
jgi:hypothetical protein